MAYKDGNIVIGTSVDVGGMNTGLYQIQKKLRKFTRVVTLAFGLRAVWKFGKGMVEAASDLQEVQNIVDQTFKSFDEDGKVIEDMTWKIDALADVSIEKFGMSEFAARETAGAYMAMGRSMGFTMEEASDLAVKLTEVTGDFASFRNISQEYARVAMSAVYTGETETLKRYGISITEATLQEYAHKMGIEKKVKAMTAQEKTIVRYNAIMEQTKFVMGDFERTQNNWANSVRVMQQRWQQFSIAVGDGLISILTPAVQKLTSIIAVLTAYVTRLWQILASIFGFELQSFVEETTQLSDKTAESADSMSDLADETKKAGKAAKGSLASFDDLNQLTSSSKSGDEDAGAEFKLPEIDLGLAKKIKEATDDLNSIDLSNLFDFGKLLSEDLGGLFDKINWDEVFKGASNFGGGLADFLNGLITPDTFSKVGTTIANSLNTVIKAALGFLNGSDSSVTDGFDFKLLGEQIAGAINNFFETFDFSGLAETINGFVLGIRTTIETAIANINWGTVWDKIVTFLTTISPETYMTLIALWFGKLLLGSITSTFTSGNLITAFGKGIKSLFTSGLGLVAKSLGLEVSTAMTTAVLGGLALLAVGIPTYILSLVDAFTNGFNALNGVLIPIGSTMAGAGVGMIIGSLGGPIGAGIGALIGLIVGLVSDLVAWWYTTNETFKESIDGFFAEVKRIWDEFWGIIVAVYDEYVKPVVDKIVQVVTEMWVEEIQPLLQELGDFVGEVINLITAVIKRLWDKTFKPFLTWFTNVFGAGFKVAWTAILNVFQSIGNAIIRVVKDIIKVFKGIITFITGVFTGDWKKAWKGVKDIFVGIAEAIVAVMGGLMNIIIDIINAIGNAVVEGMNLVKKLINSISFDVPDWVPKIGGKHMGFDLEMTTYKEIPHIKIPQLAKGAIIPPNHEFMAVLGDQKRGTNIEAPLDTIVNAFKQALNEMPNNSQRPVVIEITGDMSKFLRAQEKAEYSKNIRLGMI